MGKGRELFSRANSSPRFLDCGEWGWRRRGEWQSISAVVQRILNSPRSFKDGFGKLRHLVSEAIKTALCNRFKKEGLVALANHLKARKTLVIGVYCYYYPQKTTEWDTSHI